MQTICYGVWRVLAQYAQLVYLAVADVHEYDSDVQSVNIAKIYLYVYMVRSVILEAVKHTSMRTPTIL